MSSISDRIMKIIEAETDEKNRPIRLEEQTGIAATTWKNFIYGKQKATVQMVEAVARLWPDYAYWLSTGATEPEHGHVAPTTVESKYPIVRGSIQKWASAERKYIQQLLSQMPVDSDERDALESKIRDEVFHVRERLVMPAVHLNHERIARALKEEAKDDLFLAEYDSELRSIRMSRWEEESKLRQQIYNERSNMTQGIRMETGLDKLLKFFRLRK